MANSCKAIAVLGGQPEEVALHAFDYGRHLVCPRTWHVVELLIMV